MALTTVDIVKDTLGLTGTKFDTLIGDVVAAVSRDFADCCGRGFEREVDKVEFPRGGDDCLQLRVYPIETVTELKQSVSLDFDNAEAMVGNEDFVIESAQGIEDNVGVIRRRYGRFHAAAEAVRVIYTGGYWTGDPAGMPAGARPLPPSIAAAAKLQAVHLFQHRSDFGKRSVVMGDMSMSEVYDGMLKTVEKRLAPYVNHA